MPEGHDDGRQTGSGWHSEIEWELDIDQPTALPGRDRGLSAVIIATLITGVVVTIGVIAWFLATSPETEPVATPTAAEQAEASPTPTPEPTPTPTEAPAALDIEEAVAFVESRASQQFRQQLSLAAASMGIAYRSADQLTLIDFGSGEIAPVLGELDDPELGEVDLLRAADGRTYAIDAATREAKVVAAEGYLVETMWSGFVTRTRSAEPLVGAGEVATIVNLDGTMSQHTVALPEGGRRVVLDRVGLVIVTDAGSDLVGLGEFVHLSDNEIVAGTPSAWLERACDDTRCELRLIDFATSEIVAVLPDTFYQPGSSFVVSPDGHYVLRVSDDGSADLYSAVDGGISWVTGEGMKHATWAPDTSFVAWLDIVESPTLKLMFISPREWIVVDFEIIGATAPDGSEVVVVS